MLDFQGFGRFLFSANEVAQVIASVEARDEKSYSVDDIRGGILKGRIRKEDYEAPFKVGQARSSEHPNVCIVSLDRSRMGHATVIFKQQIIPFQNRQHECAARQAVLAALKQGKGSEGIPLPTEEELLEAEGKGFLSFVFPPLNLHR